MKSFHNSSGFSLTTSLVTGFINVFGTAVATLCKTLYIVVHFVLSFPDWFKFFFYFRGKRVFSKQRLTHLLNAEGIDSDKLMPKIYPDDHKVQLNKSPDPAPFPPFLPLEIFDNEEYDSRTPGEWLSLGVEPSSDIRHPVPAKALLPSDDGVDKSKLYA